MTEDKLPQDEMDEQQPPPADLAGGESDEVPAADEIQAEPDMNAAFDADDGGSLEDEVERQMLEELAKAEAEDAGSAGEMDITGATMPNIVADHPLGNDPIVSTAEFGDLPRGTSGEKPRNIELLMDVKLPISIELGRTEMSIHSILELSSGSVVELNKLAGEPVDLLVNNKVIAKGEVVVVDENFGLRITSLISPEERVKAL